MGCVCTDFDRKGLLMYFGGLLLFAGIAALVAWGYVDTVHHNKTDWGCENAHNTYSISPCIITSLDQTTAELLLGEQWQHRTTTTPSTLDFDACNTVVQHSLQTNCIGFIDSCVYDQNYVITNNQVDLVLNELCDDSRYCLFANGAAWFVTLFLMIFLPLLVCICRGFLIDDSSGSIFNIEIWEWPITLLCFEMSCVILFGVILTIVGVFAADIADASGPARDLRQQYLEINDPIQYDEANCMIQSIDSMEYLTWTEIDTLSYKTLVKYDAILDDRSSYMLTRLYDYKVNMTQYMTLDNAIIGQRVSCFPNAENKVAQLQQPSKAFLNDEFTLDMGYGTYWILVIGIVIVLLFVVYVCHIIYNKI
eukprot:474907_1